MVNACREPVASPPRVFRRTRRGEVFRLIREYDERNYPMSASIPASTDKVPAQGCDVCGKQQT